MNRVAQPSRLRVAAASRRQHKHPAGRLANSQARTPALHLPGSSWPNSRQYLEVFPLHEPRAADVAQNCILLYRRIAFGRAPANPGASLN